VNASPLYTATAERAARVFNSALQGVALHPFLGSVGQSARRRARLTHLRVRDLKHTFGRRLRAAGVSFEDRQDLLGHRSGRITTHYSAAELETECARAMPAKCPHWCC